MLEYLRDMSGKPVAKVLIAVLTFSFVGWGVAEWIFSGNMREPVLIQVGSEKITVNQFNVERSREMAKLSRERQKLVYTDPEYANAFYSKVLTEMTNNLMVESRARDLGFYVTEKRVASEISTFPEFRENGRFSAAKFDATLSNSGWNEADFAEYLRGQIMRSYVLGAMSVPMHVPDFAVAAAFNSRYATRQIDYKEIKFSQFNAGNPTDDQLREFYAKNPKTNPETRSVSYVLVTASMDKPDSYDAGFDKAQKLEDAIISGESMSAAASKNKAKFVSLAAFSKDKRPTDPLLTDVMVNKIFSMEQGMESEVIETKQGFVIIRVEKINPMHTAEFATVKDSYVKGWKTEEMKKQAYLAANESLIALNKNGDFKDAKRDVNVTRASGAPTDVLVAAFRQEIGSNAIVPGLDAFYVVSVKKEIAPKADAAKMAALRKELQNLTTRAIMEDYNSFLIREYPVKINTKNFEKFFQVK
ncbi:MAG: SurA N-terminal domain-containing protein [Rickettsiales bacterium]|jgi:peptidyl-prolyl cis-trans isomerase D|nr:SurA N-terminal domain-containing protein [Rickettsiales bacterium]